MKATLALLALVGLLAVVGVANASSDNEVSMPRNLLNIGYWGLGSTLHNKWGFYKYDHYPELKIKYVHKCHGDDCEDDYKCHDDCDEDSHCHKCDDHDSDCHQSCHDDDEDKCEKKYIRRCYYKHNHKKCHCKHEDEHKYYVVIKKKGHCH